MENNNVEEPTLAYNKVYTYADYLRWKIDEKIEILKGKIFKMSPAPARIHQDASRELGNILYTYFKKKECKVYVAPFDVRLVSPSKNSPKDEDITTVFQPDLCVICDKSKLDDRGCLGAPDLIVEIVSPGNSKKELKNKFEIYEEYKVREYWIVDYVSKTILLYVLEKDKFIGLKPFTEDEEFKSVIFPELSFDVSEIFVE